MKYLLIIPIALLLVGCCGENYVKEMTKISNKTSKQLGAFYEKNKRPPSIKERNEILKDAGCSMLQENICVHNNRKITVESDNSNTGYNLGFNYGKNYCYLGLGLHGDIDSVSCKKSDCIKFGQ